VVASRQPAPISADIEAVETQDWIDALDDVIYGQGPERVRSLLADLQIRAQQAGVELPVTSITPYINTIPVDRQAPYPGDREVERRIKSLIRWNAMAMVVRANKADSSIGGHISSYASSATLYEVGFNHFFRGKDSVRGRVALEVDEVRVTIGVLAAKEVIEADFVEGRGRRVGRNVAADAGVLLVLAMHHGHGVPADQALDAALELAVAGIRNFVLHRDGVQVGRVELDWNVNAGGASALYQGAQQLGALVGTFVVHNLVEGFQPLGHFLLVLRVRLQRKLDYGVHGFM
jgi:hypothetical protein